MKNAKTAITAKYIILNETTNDPASSELMIPLFVEASNQRRYIHVQITVLLSS